jgi:hypothetical protein
MAAKTWALGTQVKRLNPSSAIYETVPGLRDITGPDVSVDWLDLTTHDSPNSTEEGIPTIHRSGEVRAEMIYDPANSVHQALLTDKQSKRLGTWRVVMTDPSATYVQFSAYVISLGFSFPVAGALQQNFILRPTGALTTGTGG